MAGKCEIDPTRITTVLTSCGRFDLLEDTIASFLTHFAVPEILVAEDSQRSTEAAAFAEKFPQVKMRINESKLGQMRSIDEVYATLKTPYVLHLEDDWCFTRSLDVERVIAFLESRPDVSVVCIANRTFEPRYDKSAHKCRFQGVDYIVWDLDAHPKWFSYTFNPSIARLSLWNDVGPFARFATEENLSQSLKARGMRIAMITPSIADHIGEKRHVADPFQPPRPQTLGGRLKRSIAKRWAKVREGRAS